MKVEGILRKKGRCAQTIQQWSTIAEALRRLAGPPRIGALIVTQSNGQVAGMITERLLLLFVSVVRAMISAAVPEHSSCTDGTLRNAANDSSSDGD